jgi:hypothetical protein
MAEHGEARQLLARAVEQLPEREKVVSASTTSRGSRWPTSAASSA